MTTLLNPPTPTRFQNHPQYRYMCSGFNVHHGSVNLAHMCCSCTSAYLAYHVHVARGYAS
uniref:Uncharacterized protein n=1 Tax=Arundo donax TaxID=35708 RepID=A0A0A9AD41_ARUDO